MDKRPEKRKIGRQAKVIDWRGTRLGELISNHKYDRIKITNGPTFLFIGIKQTKIYKLPSGLFINQDSIISKTENED